MQFKKPAQKSSRSSVVGEFLKENQSVHSKGSFGSHGNGLLGISGESSDSKDEESIDRILAYLRENGPTEAPKLISVLGLSVISGMRLLDQLEKYSFISSKLNAENKVEFSAS
jgi:hypothetical protein